MNGYLLRKCRSEQQLMNELSKLLVSKDYASKKMTELLRELSFFYVSPSFARVPHSVLKDLIALLTHLKDKKDDLRIARLVLCLLARIVEQFELRYHEQALVASKGGRTQSFDMSLSMASGLLKVIESQELNHSSAARQVACLKLYGHLSRIFNTTDALLLRLKPIIQKSPAWGLLFGDKKVAATITGKKDFQGQLSSLAAAFHCTRFHLGYDEQSHHLMESLLQAAFLPNAVASRHAAATLLKLFELSNDHARQVTASFENFFTKFRPPSLRVGDALASIYLLRLCGQLSRLPPSDAGDAKTRTENSFGQKRPSFSSNLLDFSFDAAPTATAGTASAGAGAGGGPVDDTSPPPSPIARQRQRLEGVKASSLLTSRLKDMLLDILCAPPSPSDASPMVKALTLAAVEEAVLDANADACIMKTRAGVSLFEVAAGVLLKQLTDALTNSSALQLHRVVRAIQSTAEALDGSVLQMTDYMDHQPQFMDRITDHVVGLVAHANPFVAFQSLRALVWLLPRPTKHDAKWEMLLARLRSLPVQQVQPESRQFIVEAFFQRAVTNPSLHRHAVDVEMLRQCQHITLLWCQTQPCEWHAPMLLKIWTTALRKCYTAMGDGVFAAVNAVLDLQHHALRATAELVRQWTLDFLARVGAAYVASSAADPRWFRALSLRLTKQLVLESLVSRRLTVAVLAELHWQALHAGRGEIVQHVASLSQYLTQSPPSQANANVFVATQIHAPRAKDALGLQGQLVKCLEPRGPSTALQLVAGRSSTPGLPLASTMPSMATIPTIPTIITSASPLVAREFAGMF